MQTNIDDFFNVRRRPVTGKLSGTIPLPIHVAAESNKEAGKPTTPTQSSHTVKTLLGNLNLGEYKNIRRHKEYSSLKNKFKKYKGTASRLKQIEDSLSEFGTAESKKFDSVEVKAPSGPIKCEIFKPKGLFWTSPVPSPAKDLPSAFETYSHLTTGKETLVLPHKYLVLKKIFRWVDILSKVKSDRNQIITFDELKKDLSTISNGNISESHLAKIKAVYPESYAFFRGRVKILCSHEELYQLIIKRLSHTVEKEDNKTSVELTNSERLQVIHDRLLNRTKTYHQEFLSNLNPPIVVDSDELNTWHPEFELNNVPDVVPEPLPQPPVQHEVFTAKTILEKAHDLNSINKRTEQAVGATAEQKKKAKESEPSTSDPLPAFKKALKNIPKSILKKVRAREAAKMAEMITQTPAEAEEAIMLSRLPELARIMRNVFVSEKKGILPAEIVILKMSHSYREKLPQNDLMEHIKLISKHVPGWINICRPIVRKPPYIRLSKDADMSRVLGKLQKMANLS